MEKTELLQKARLLPATPGVYIMRDKFDRVIYVGKSKALKNRVSSYFAPGGVPAGAALFGLLFYEESHRSLCLHPHRVLSGSQGGRLLY